MNNKEEIEHNIKIVIGMIEARELELNIIKNYIWKIGEINDRK